MAYDLEARVSIVETTVRAEAEKRVKLDKKVDAHFNAHRRLFQAVQETQSEHTALLRKISGKVDTIESHMEHFETRMDGLDNRMGRVEAKVENLDSKIDAVGERLDGKIDAVDRKLDEKFTQLDGKIDSVIEMLRSGPR